MQEKERNISPVKQRILQFVVFLGISKRQFYTNTGISRGTLDNSSGITEETLAKLFAVYKNINPIWLFTGDGEMLFNQVESVLIAAEPEIKYGKCPDCVKKDAYIEKIEHLMNTQERYIARLERQLDGESGDKSKQKTA